MVAACSDSTSGSSSALREANDGRESPNRGVFGLDLLEMLLQLKLCGNALDRCTGLEGLDRLLVKSCKKPDKTCYLNYTIDTI